MQQDNRLGGGTDNNNGQNPQPRRRQRPTQQPMQQQQQLTQQQQQQPQKRKKYVTSSRAFGLGIVASIGVTLIAGGGLVVYSMIRDSSVTNYVDSALKQQKQMLQEQQAVVNLSPTTDTMKKVTDPNANITVTRVKNGATETVSGAGVIIRSDGAILTNEHVVKDAKSIKVTIGGIEYDADYLHGDASSDLAVIVCEGAKNLPTVLFGDSTALYQGQYVMSIGNPYGLNDTLSTGTVSALGRDILYRDGTQEIMYANMVQTDTSTNPGNSGGGLFNEKGELVGIMTIIATDGTSDVNSKANSKGSTKNSGNTNTNENTNSNGEITDATADNENDNANSNSNENDNSNSSDNSNDASNSTDQQSSDDQSVEQQGYAVMQQDSNAQAGSTGIAYAIPASYAKSIARNLLNDKDAAHASLGVSIDDVPDSTVTKFGLKSNDGAIVTNVTQSGPAQIAGITNDDVITTFNGIKVVNSQDLQFKVRALPINTEVEIKVLREGKEMTFKVKLGSDAN